MRRLRRPSGGLWSNTDFLKLWTGQSISEFGSQVSALAIPSPPIVSTQWSISRQTRARNRKLPSSPASVHSTSFSGGATNMT